MKGRGARVRALLTSGYSTVTDFARFLGLPMSQPRWSGTMLRGGWSRERVSGTAISGPAQV